MGCPSPQGNHQAATPGRLRPGPGSPGYIPGGWGSWHTAGPARQGLSYPACAAKEHVRLNGGFSWGRKRVAGCLTGLGRRFAAPPGSVPRRWPCTCLLQLPPSWAWGPGRVRAGTELRGAGSEGPQGEMCSVGSTAAQPGPAGHQPGRGSHLMCRHMSGVPGGEPGSGTSQQLSVSENSEFPIHGSMQRKVHTERHRVEWTGQAGLCRDHAVSHIPLKTSWGHGL